MPIYIVDGREFELLPSEYKNLLFVKNIGLDRAERLLELVGNRMKRRAALYNSERVYFDYVFDDFNVAKPWGNRSAL